MKTWIAAALALVALAAPVRAQEAAPADIEQEFYRAFYAENGLRDFPRAIRAYADVAVAAEKAGRKDLRSKALVGQARCLRTDGQADAATVVIATLLRHDPGNAEAMQLQAALAGTPAAEEDAELHHRCTILMGNLGDASAWREFDLLGEHGRPFLEEGLRGRELEIVEGAARILATGAIPGGREALVRALADRRVVYARVLCDAVLDAWDIEQSAREAVPEDLPLLEAVARRPEAELRRRVVRRLAASALGRTEAAGALVRALAADPSPEVRCAILETEWPAGFSAVLGSLRLEATGSRSAAERALAAAGLRNHPDVVRREAAGIRRLLGDPEAEVRRAAFGTLAEHGALAQGDLAALLGDAEAGLVGDAADRLRETRSWLPATLDAVRAALQRGIRGALPEGAFPRVMELAGAREEPAGASLVPEDFLALFALASSPECRLGDEEGAAARARFVQEIHVLAQGSSPSAGERGLRLVEAGVERLSPPEAVLEWMTLWIGLDFYSARSCLLAGVSPDPRIRLLAYDGLQRFGASPVASALGGRPLSSVLPSLAGDIASGDRDLASFAISLAAGYPDRTLGAALRSLRRNPPEGRAGELLVALASAFGREAEPEVREALASTDAEMRTSALYCLLVLLRSGTPGDIDAYLSAGGEPRRVAGMFRGARAPSDDLLGEFLQRLPAQRFTGEILDLARRLPAAPRREILLRCLRAPASEPRRAAAAATAAWREVEFTNEVANLLDDPDPQVRAAAQKALEDLRAYIELKASAARIRDGGASSTFVTAEQMLQDADPVKRKGGVLALAALGDKAAIPILLRVLDDGDESVRAAAMAALERMGAAR